MFTYKCSVCTIEFLRGGLMAYWEYQHKKSVIEQNHVRSNASLKNIRYLTTCRQGKVGKQLLIFRFCQRDPIRHYWQDGVMSQHVAFKNFGAEQFENTWAFDCGLFIHRVQVWFSAFLQQKRFDEVGSNCCKSFRKNCARLFHEQ